MLGKQPATNIDISAWQWWSYPERCHSLPVQPISGPAVMLKLSSTAALQRKYNLTLYNCSLSHSLPGKIICKTHNSAPIHYEISSEIEVQNYVKTYLLYTCWLCYWNFQECSKFCIIAIVIIRHWVWLMLIKGTESSCV